MRILLSLLLSLGLLSAPGVAHSADGDERSSTSGTSVGDDLRHTPPAAQVVSTPVPLYVEVRAGTKVAKVLVLYKPFGADDWQKITLLRLSEGYGAEIPCAAVSTTGDLRYYIQVVDPDGDVVLTRGSRQKPNRVAIQSAITDEPPHLPGRPPPARCREVADCPPGLQGCAALPARSTPKGWGRACTRDPDCDEGLACKNQKCEMGEKTEIATEPVIAVPAAESRGKRTWLALSIAQDFAVESSRQNICGSPANDTPPHTTCYAGATHYSGIPDYTDAARGTNQVGGGVRIAATRVLAEIFHFLGDHIAVGARLGVALGNQPNHSVGALHAEGRLTYWFGDAPLGTTAFRPYVLAAAGFAEEDTKASTSIQETICKTPDECALPANQSRALSPNPTLTVWRQSGPFFAGGGVGAMIATLPNQGVLVEVKVVVYAPGSGWGMAPSVGYALGF